MTVFCSRIFDSDNEIWLLEVTHVQLGAHNTLQVERRLAGQTGPLGRLAVPFSCICVVTSLCLSSYY